MSRDLLYLLQAEGVPPGTRGSDQLGSSVRRIVEPILGSLGLVLVEVEIRGRGPKSLVRVIVERAQEEGVTLEDCQRAHVLLGHALDVEDPIPHTYLLEVSSPGLDRPIRNINEYQRFQGRMARFKMKKPVSGQLILLGRIQKLEANEVWIEAQLSRQRGVSPKAIALPLNEIAEARLEVEF